MEQNLAGVPRTKKRILVIRHKYEPGCYDVYLEQVWFSVWGFHFWFVEEGQIDLSQSDALCYQGELLKKHRLSSLDIVEK